MNVLRTLFHISKLFSEKSILISTPTKSLRAFVSVHLHQHWGLSLVFNLSSLIGENSIPVFFEIKVVVTYRPSPDAMARDRAIVPTTSVVVLIHCLSVLAVVVSCGCILVSL